MNKDPAKEPKDEGKWQAIDIYLFSNGQQNSPPRKYHLKAEDLNWWDSTLNHLAKAHYGTSQEAIDIYTIDGQKLEGPLGLIDGSAYVAIVRGEAFIESGYEKYLIKASRSWEKRKAKKTSISEKADEVRTGLEEEGQPTTHESEATELTTIKLPDENIAVESIMVKPQRTSILKLEKSEAQPPLKGIIASPRLSLPKNDKNRLSAQHAAFAKADNGSTIQQKRNSINKSKEGFHRKMLTKIPIKVNEPTKAIPTKPKKNSNVLHQPSSPIPQVPPATPALPPSPQVPQLLQTPLAPSKPDQHQKMLNKLQDKSLVADAINPENNILDKDVIVIAADVYNTVNSDIKSFKTNTNGSNAIDELVTNTIRKAIEEEVQTQADQAPEKVNTTDTGVSGSKTKITVNCGTFTEDNNIITCNIPLEDNYIAVINKGEAVNLNLTIELQKSQTVQSTSCSNLDSRQVRKISSILNIFKKDTAQSKKDEETAVQNKSLESVINSVNDCFAKVVVVQCACCGNHTTIPRIDTMPVYKDDNGFFVLMPGPPLAEGMSCGCPVYGENNSVDSKLFSELCPDLNRTKSGTDYPVVAKDPGIVMTVMNCGIPRIEDWQKNIFDTYMMTRIERQVSINENQCSASSCCPTPSQVIDRKACVVVRNELQRSGPCQTMESSTQTEWCRVLLQVKFHDDGRYTFHLPPLEMLKYCSL